MDIKKFIKTNKEKIKNIFYSLNFSSISPILLYIVAAIASEAITAASGTFQMASVSSISVAVPSFLLELIKNIQGFSFNEAAKKIIKGKTSELTEKEIDNLRSAIENLSKKLEELSENNLEVDKVINDFVHELLSDEDFNKIFSGLNLKLDDLRNEVSARLDNIQEELSIINKVNLPRIESVLEKGADKPPEFFRTYGPIWIDFEEGFVYERPEVNEIIEKLKMEDIVVIKGEPASGKSVVLRNVGYKLANDGADVYYIGLKTCLPEKLEEISKIRHGYILVDDAHLNLDFVEDLLLNKPNAKVIIASRDIDIEKIFGPTTERKFVDYLKNGIEIKAKYTADKIIKKFEEKEKMPRDIKDRLIKNNLWILAWQLKSYKEHKRIDGESVLLTVKEHIEMLFSSSGKHNGGKPENVLLPLAIFFRHETPIRKAFIEKMFDDNNEIIKELERLNEIPTFSEKGRDYVALHHSEVAEIYFETFNKFEDFGWEVKNKINKEHEEIFGTSDNSDIELKLLNVYLREYPEETTNVLYMSGKYTYPDILEISYKNFNDIIKGLEKEDEIQKIGVCIGAIASIDQKVAAKIVKRLNIDTLVKKINKEEDIFKIGICIERIARANKEITDIILERIDIDNLIKKINKEEYIIKISYCIREIARANKEFVYKIVERIDIDSLIKKINKEEDINKIMLFIEGMPRANKEFADKILEKIIDSLIEKINKEEDIGKIGDCIERIARANKEITDIILERIDIDNLIEKINKEEDPFIIAILIQGIKKANKTISLKLLNTIESGKIEEVLQGLEKIEEVLQELEKRE